MCPDAIHFPPARFVALHEVSVTPTSPCTSQNQAFLSRTALLVTLTRGQRSLESEITAQLCFGQPVERLI